MTDGGCFDTLLGKPIRQVPLPCHVHGINESCLEVNANWQAVCMCPSIFLYISIKNAFTDYLCRCNTISIKGLHNTGIELVVHD